MTLLALSLLAWVPERDLVHSLHLSSLLSMSLVLGVFVVDAWCVSTTSASAPLRQSTPRRFLRLLLAFAWLGTAAWLWSLATWQPGVWKQLVPALWPVGLVGLVGLGMATVASKFEQEPLHSHGLDSILGALAAAIAILAQAFAMGFRLDPYSWLAHPRLLTAIATPWTREIFFWAVSWGTFAGAALVLPRCHRQFVSASFPRWIFLLSGAVGSLVLATQAWWMPTWVLPPHLSRIAAAGSGAVSFAERAAMSATLIWVLGAWLTAFTARVLPYESWPRHFHGALFLAALLAGWLGHASLEARFGPWGLGRHMYVSGVSVRHLDVLRRRPTVTPPTWRYDRASDEGRLAVGRRVYEQQCRFCHAARGPWSVHSAVSNWSDAHLAEFLERQRDGERLGHPWRNVMPPLVGSDDELRALRLWIRQRPTPER